MTNANETVIDLGDEKVVVTWNEDEPSTEAMRAAETARIVSSPTWLVATAAGEIELPEAANETAAETLDRSLAAGAAMLTQIAALLVVALHSL